MKQILINIDDQEKRDFIAAVKINEGQFAAFSIVMRRLMAGYVTETKRKQSELFVQKK